MASTDFDIGKYARIKAKTYGAPEQPVPQIGDIGKIVDIKVTGDSQEYHLVVPCYDGEWSFTWREIEPITFEDLIRVNNTRNRFKS